MKHHSCGMLNYGNNNVTVKLNDGRSVVTAYNPGPQGVNPFSQMVLPGPFNYIAAVSLYQTFSNRSDKRLASDSSWVGRESLQVKRICSACSRGQMRWYLGEALRSDSVSGSRYQ
jgi:hypothetical protein